MKGKVLNIIIFVLSLFSLIVSIKLFYNLGIYVDEVNISPDVVLGGDLWLIMNWLRLGASAVICLLSGINLIKNNR